MDAILNRGFCYLHSQKFEEALKDFVVCIEKKFQEPVCHFYTSLIQYHYEQYDACLESLDKAIALEPHDVDLLKETKENILEELKAKGINK